VVSTVVVDIHKEGEMMNKLLTVLVAGLLSTSVFAAKHMAAEKPAGMAGMSGMAAEKPAGMSGMSGMEAKKEAKAEKKAAKPAKKVAKKAEKPAGMEAKK
jgi:hypothetical protein